MNEQTRIQRASENKGHEQEAGPAAKRISFFATDGAIPLNFMPLPQEYDPDGRSTEGDIAVDRTLARVSSWVRRPQRVVARWATPFVCLRRKSEKRPTVAREM